MAQPIRALVVHPGDRHQPGNGPIDLYGLPDSPAQILGGPVLVRHGYRTVDDFDATRPTVTFLLNRHLNPRRYLFPRATRTQRAPTENGLGTALYWHYNRFDMGRDLYGPTVIVGGPNELGYYTDLPDTVMDVYLELVSGAYPTGFNY